MTIEEYCKLNVAIEILDKAKADLSYLAGQDGNTSSVVWSTIGNVNEGMASNQTNIAVLQKEIELLKLQIEEIKVSTSNPLSN